MLYMYTPYCLIIMRSREAPLPLECVRRAVHVVGERGLHLEVGVVDSTEGHGQWDVRRVQHVGHAGRLHVKLVLHVRVTRPHLHSAAGRLTHGMKEITRLFAGPCACPLVVWFVSWSFS